MNDRSQPRDATVEADQGVLGEARVDGVRIVHESWGAGPPLICCHAFGVSRSMWALQRARFARGHRVITFDQRGCGESDHPAPEDGAASPYTIDRFADDLRGVLDDLGVARARVLGVSMGGATALRFATRWPERVGALVLASTMASRLPEKIIARAKAVEGVLDRDGLRAAYGFYFGGPLFDGVPRGGESDGRFDALLANATPDGFRGSYRVTIDRPSMAAELHRIQAPTLILVGERDVLYLEDAEMMARSIPRSRKVVLPGVGHAMSIEAPDVFAEEVMRFLEDPRLGAPTGIGDGARPAPEDPRGAR
jgi:pimeloyl-ACP methyl ester carboxylesterase